MNTRLKKNIACPATVVARFMPIAAAILCWVAAVLFVKYFSYRMDIHTQNFFRYLGASIFLAAVSAVAYPGCFRIFIARAPVFFLLGAMVVGFQICWVRSIYSLGPAFVSLLSKLSTILITIAAFLLYHEERVVVRNKRFLAGFVMGLAGVAGVVIGHAGIQAGSAAKRNNRNFVLPLLASSVIWAVYVNVVKHVLRQVNSLQAFTFTCICATVYLLPIMLIWGQPASLLDGSTSLMGLVIISGIVGVAGCQQQLLRLDQADWHGTKRQSGPASAFRNRNRQFLHFRRTAYSNPVALRDSVTWWLRYDNQYSGGEKTGREKTGQFHLMH